MKVLVVYYSMYAHVLEMAQAVVAGVKEVAGVDAVFRRVQEFADLEQDIPRHKHALAIWNRQKDTPVCTLDDLKDADGILFGTPTRFGNMTAQMKRLFDSLVQLWLAGALEGKPAGIFTSTATTHGGQETTPFTMMAPLLHLGMLIVGVPYSTPGMLHTEGRGVRPTGLPPWQAPAMSLAPRRRTWPSPGPWAAGWRRWRRICGVEKRWGEEPGTKGGRGRPPYGSLPPPSNSHSQPHK